MAEKETTSVDYLQQAINGIVTLGSSYFKSRSEAEASKLQAATTASAIETDKAVSSNTTRNILLIVGGTLGLILVFSTAKKLLK